MKSVAYKLKYIWWKFDVKENITKHFRTITYHKDNILNFGKLFQPFLTMSRLSFILIVSLSAKTDQKPNE